MKNLLRLKDGKVDLINSGGQTVKHYYSKGDCVRCDWYEEKEESVQVQLSNGKILIINRGCQVIKIL